MAHLPLSYSLRNVVARRTRVALTVLVIALVVLSVTLMLSLVSGIRRTLVQTGHPDNLIVFRKGSTNDGASMIPIEAYRTLRFLDGIATDPASGRPMVSPEMVVQPFFYTAGGGRENVLVRGVEPVAFAVHDSVRIVEGRALRPGAGEVLVGRGVQVRYAGIEVGRELAFGRRSWHVVGIFESGGTAFESEVWVDVRDLWTDANRSIYSGLRLRVAPDADRAALVDEIESEPRWALEARPETDYYAEQGESASFLLGLTMALAVIMGLGASFGAMNTMFAAVESRTVEIGTLRALGFPSAAILRSFVTEAVAIALAGFAVGIVLALGATVAVTAWLEGVAFNLATFTTAVVRLRVTPADAGLALLLALVLGVGGGWLPARRAARLRPAEALRKG